MDNDEVEQIVAAGAGWTPEHWAERLDDLAAACQPFDPDRAQRLREAAVVTRGRVSDAD